MGVQVMLAVAQIISKGPRRSAYVSPLQCMWRFPYFSGSSLRLFWAFGVQKSPRNFLLTFFEPDLAKNSHCLIFREIHLVKVHTACVPTNELVAFKQKMFGIILPKNLETWTFNCVNSQKVCLTVGVVAKNVPVETNVHPRGWWKSMHSKRSTICGTCRLTNWLSG